MTPHPCVEWIGVGGEFLQNLFGIDGFAPSEKAGHVFRCVKRGTPGVPYILGDL
jgi:hypothetical protein